jgi:PAS domain S-box-containing protein
MNNDKSSRGAGSAGHGHSLHKFFTLDPDGNAEGQSFCDVLCRNYAYIVEHAPVSVVITDARGLIEFVNPKFEEVTGYKAHEVLGKNPGIIKSGEMPLTDYSALWKTILSGRQWTGEFHNRRKNGELFWENAIIDGIVDDSGKITHFIAIKEDITEVKEARKKLEQERLRMIQNSKMAEIGQMASGILHEVGNPIAAIRGLICDIRESCQTSEESISLNRIVAAQLDEVLAEVDRITGITMDISEFSYSRHAVVELLDLNSLISTTCRLMRYDRRWSNIALELHLDDHLPPVHAVKDHIVQILMNLLSNAAHAVEQVGGQSWRVDITTSATDESVQVRVADNGCGIEPDDLPRVFDPFYSNKARGEGSGLGLALCKSLIDERHGEISLSSQPGVGTEVCISLPVHAPQG